MAAIAPSQMPPASFADHQMVQVHYRPSSQGPHMLADSTGIKSLGEGEWKTKKHGAERRRQWRKVHLGIDADTLQIRAIVVTIGGDEDELLQALG